MFCQPVHGRKTSEGIQLGSSLFNAKLNLLYTSVAYMYTHYYWDRDPRLHVFRPLIEILAEETDIDTPL